MKETNLLQRDRSILCVVDIQEKLMARMPEKEKVIDNARLLVQSAMRLGVPILLTEQYPKGLGRTVIELTAALGDKYSPIEKMTFGCSEAPRFLDELKDSKRKQVVLCGVETHVCVLQTCLDLLQRKLAVQVMADAVCSRKPEHKTLALEQMRQAGAAITSAESVIFQWLGKAGTPEFKDILSLIK